MIRISCHAAIRLLERVAGLDLCHLRWAATEELGRSPMDGELIEVIFEHTGLSWAHIYKMLPMRTIEQAVAAGATSIRTGDARYIVENRVLVTVAPNSVRRGKTIKKAPKSREKFQRMREL